MDVNEFAKTTFDRQRVHLASISVLLNGTPAPEAPSQNVMLFQ